jgi:hypothetical protein
VNQCHDVTLSRTSSTGSLKYVDQFDKNKDVLSWFRAGVDTAYLTDENSVQQTMQFADAVGQFFSSSDIFSICLEVRL